MTSSNQTTPPLDHGRECYRRRAWADAFQALSEANRITPLAPGDLQLLALSAALSGNDEDFLAGLERLHGLYLDAGEFAAAARAGAVFRRPQLPLRRFLHDVHGVGETPPGSSSGSRLG